MLYPPNVDQNTLFITLYWALPALLANAIPVVAARWNWLASLAFPLDGGRQLRGKRIFGDHKTMRGMILGIICGTVVGILQYFLSAREIIEIGALEAWSDFALFGALAGAGALVGDAIESFFKRQIGIASGRPFIPFDQTDYILGFLIFTSVLIEWQFQQALFLLTCGFVLSFTTNQISYRLGIKKTHW